MFGSPRKSFNEDGSLSRISIPLEKKVDSYGGVFYVAVVQDDTLEVNLEDGQVFLVFTSVEGKEELQIVPDKSESDDDKANHRSGQYPEVHRLDPRRSASAYSR
jgi:hypothetical protein